MIGKRNYTISELRDYSSLFARGEVSRWCKKDFSSIRIKISRHTPEVLGQQYTYLSYLKYVYSVIERHYRNEYVYKNEFISKWLLKEVGTEKSVLYSEFKMGKAIGDLVMFNGCSKVFEIKTLLDGERRLASQLPEYFKLFNEVYLIVPESKVGKYCLIEPTTGIISYGGRKGAFSLVREASFNNYLDVEVLMQVLHTKEYVSIVEKHYGSKPIFNDFNKFEVCKQLMKDIPSERLNELFILAMKARKRHHEIGKTEKQFNQLFLSLNYSVKERKALLHNLTSTID
jgi:hypothetical protein